MIENKINILLKILLIINLNITIFSFANSTLLQRNLDQMHMDRFIHNFLHMILN